MALDEELQIGVRREQARGDERLLRQSRAGSSL
jgi:hypothetical protein